MELGPTLATLRTGGRVLTVETDCPEALALLEELVRLIQELERVGCTLGLEMVLGGPGAPSSRPRRGVGLEDLLQEVERERALRVDCLPERAQVFLDDLGKRAWFELLDRPPGEPLEAGYLALSEALLEIGNALSTALIQRDPFRFSRCWRPVEALVRAAVEELVEDQAGRAEVELPRSVLRGLEVLVGTAAMEVWLQDVALSSPLREWVDQLRSGRVPIGWRGVFPDGELLVA